LWKRLGEGKDNQPGMLKEEKVVFLIVSALPLLWLLNLLVMLAIGAYELGKIPKYEYKRSFLNSFSHGMRNIHSFVLAGKIYEYYRVLIAIAIAI
jgi:sorbitol-specific phosphotransferase system component IIC